MVSVIIVWIKFFFLGNWVEDVKVGSCICFVFG